MKQRGTGFTNVSRILQANQGNRLGRTVSGGIQQASKDVKTGIQQAQSSFDKESKEKSLNIDEAKQKRDAILGKVTGATPIMQQSGVAAPEQTEGSRPAPVSMPAPTTSTTVDRSQEQPTVTSTPTPFQASNLTDQDVQDFQKFRTASYTGPKELQNTEALINQAQQAEGLGNLARSTGGQQELLRRFVGGEGYTQGQRKLDQTILSQDRDADLTTAARQTRGVLTDVNRATEQARNVAQERQGRASAFASETGRMVQEAQNPIMSGLETRLSEAQTREQQLGQNFDSVQNILRGVGDFGRLSGQERLDAGLNKAIELGIISNDELQQIKGPDGFLTRGSRIGLDMPSIISERLQLQQGQNLTQGGVASEEERAKLQALNRLAGGLETDYALAGQDDQYQAGGAKIDRESFDKSIIESELPFYQNRVRELDAQYAQAEAFRREFSRMGFLNNKDDRTYNNWIASLNAQKAARQAELDKVTQRKTYYDNLAREQLSDETKKTDISYDPKDVEKFMGRLKASSYDYKKEVQDSPLASKNREIGVMAQDLEKSKLGKEAVKDTKIGKIVDYDNLGPKMLASIANLNERLKKMEGN